MNPSASPPWVQIHETRTLGDDGCIVATFTVINAYGISSSIFVWDGGSFQYVATALEMVQRPESQAEALAQHCYGYRQPMATISDRDPCRLQARCDEIKLRVAALLTEYAADVIGDLPIDVTYTLGPA